MSKQEYLLTCNFLGYITGGSKRALVQQVGDEAVSYPVKWYLKDEKGDVTASGSVGDRQASYGKIVYACDFSHVTAKGMFTLEVAFSGGETLKSAPFAIDDYPYLHTVTLRLAIDNARMRYAAEKTHKGYYDCNSQMGEAYSHGMFLNGLCWLDMLHGERMSASEREDLRWAQQAAFDYLMYLWCEDGHFNNYAPERAFDPRNAGINDTIEALYGLAAYMDLVGSADPERVNAENYQKLKKSFLYTERQPMTKYTLGEWLPAVAVHLYRVGGEEIMLRKAQTAAEDILWRYDWRSTNRSGWRGIGYFEGIWLLGETKPDFLETAAFKSRSAFNRKRLDELLSRSAFGFAAPNGNSLPQAWDDMSGAIQNTIGSRSFHWVLNQDILCAGLDMCFLGLMSNDAAYEKSAAASIAFTGGVNFGFPAELTEKGGKGIAAAAFIANHENGLKPWKTWYFTPKNDTWLSVINGYTVDENGAYFYTDEDWPTGETFIKTDGTLVFLLSLLESWMNGGLSLPESAFPLQGQI